MQFDKQLMVLIVLFLFFISGHSKALRKKHKRRCSDEACSIKCKVQVEKGHICDEGYCFPDDTHCYCLWRDGPDTYNCNNVDI